MTDLVASAGAGASPTHRRRIAAAIATLGGGGAERVMTSLVNAWARRGDEVTLVTLDDVEPFYELDPRVRTVRLGLSASSASPVHRARNVGRRVRALRRTLRALRPEVCVSFIDRMNVLVLAATRGLRVPTVVSERVHPGFVDPPGWGVARRIAYVAADVVVAQTEQTAAALRFPLGPPVLTIPNPVEDPGEHADVRTSRRIVAAGRLVRQKGFDLLLRAFSEVARERPSWELVIWGEGPERPNLERLAQELGVAGRARLPGQTRALSRELRGAAVFALPSRFEGFPNTLCEAMAMGLAVVATRCPSGPSEIVEAERDGILVEPEDAGELAHALARLMDDTELRQRLASRARRVRERLGVDAIVSAWDRAFERAGT